VITITSFVMPEGFLCEINLDEEVWLELGLHISRNRRKRNFFGILSTTKCSKVLQMHSFVCLKIFYVK